MSAPEVLDQHEYRGYTISIYYDMDASSPRDNDNLGRMSFLPNRDYTLPAEITEVSFSRYEEMNDLAETVAELRRSDPRGIILPLQFADYGPACRVCVAKDDTDWDWANGLVYVSAADLRREYGHKIVTASDRAKAIEVLVAEAHEYASYVSGECFGYVVEDANGNVVGSCWGYISSDEWDHMYSEGRAEVDHHIQQCHDIWNRELLASIAS